MISTKAYWSFIQYFVLPSIYLYVNLFIVFQYDPEGFGEIPWVDFLKALKTPELQAHIPSNKRDVSYKLMQSFKIYPTSIFIYRHLLPI